jgi:hypothetical protein
MFKKKTGETSSFIRKKSCNRLKKDWFSGLIETEIPSSVQTQKVKFGEIFTYQETTNYVICTVCPK